MRLGGGVVVLEISNSAWSLWISGVVFSSAVAEGRVLWCGMGCIASAELHGVGFLIFCWRA